MKKEIKYAVFVISLIIFAAASLKAQENNHPLQTLRGDEAIEKLKQNGQYESLMEAVEAARKENGQTENPATADAFGQSAKLFASDGAALEDFGISVSISGDTAIIGSYQDTVGGNGVQGSAFVFVKNGGTWSLQQKLTAADGAANDRFGISVSISGDTTIVGASQDDEGMTMDKGSAYVFVRSGTVWTEQQKLTASDGASDDRFGTSVSLDGDTALIGAERDAAGTSLFRGSAYVFVRIGTVWTEQQKLTAADGADSDNFGNSVVISGDTAVIGAQFANSLRGAVYVFVRSGTTWTQQQKLTVQPIQGGDKYFGSNLAISGDTLIIGELGFDFSTNFNQGAAYVFVRNGGVWTQQQRLTAADGGEGDTFGNSVAISGDTALIGAFGDNIGSGSGQGSAYIFVRSGTTWTQQQKLTAADGAANDNFGDSVAISGNKFLVGARRADVLVSNLFVPQVADQGAVYVFVPKVFVSGRILLSANGSSVPNATVQLTKPNGEVIQTRSSSLGYYRFDELDAGETYTISVSSKRYIFTPQMVQPNNNLTDVDFIAQP